MVMAQPTRKTMTPILSRRVTRIRALRRGLATITPTSINRRPIGKPYPNHLGNILSPPLKVIVQLNHIISVLSIFADCDILKKREEVSMENSSYPFPKRNKVIEFLIGVVCFFAWLFGVKPEQP